MSKWNRKKKFIGKLLLQSVLGLTLLGSSWQLALAMVPIQVIPTYNVNTYNNVIAQIYKTPASHSTNLETRINFASAYFMGKPYQLFPLGEGPGAQFDQSPIYRTDVFDCLTYVNTVLALVNANNVNQFQQVFNKISYKDGNVAFINRAHFVDSDWNVNNQRAGFVQDITATIHDSKGKSLAKMAVTVNDKPNWYLHMSYQRIRLLTYPGDKQAKQLMQQMQVQSRQTRAAKIATPYIPISALYKNGQPNLALFNQIPSGTVIEIIRPNLDLTRQIGTHLNVTHIGIVLRTSQGLVFRQASSDYKKVIQVPLAHYLKIYLKQPGDVGINIQLIK